MITVRGGSARMERGGQIKPEKARNFSVTKVLEATAGRKTIDTWLIFSSGFAFLCFCRGPLALGDLYCNMGKQAMGAVGRAFIIQKWGGFHGPKTIGAKKAESGALSKRHLRIVRFKNVSSEAPTTCSSVGMFGNVLV